MNQISSPEELRTAIEALEAENAVRARQLKEEFDLAAATFSPVAAVTASLREVVSSPYLLENLLGSAIGIAGGYLSRKLFVRGSSNIFRKVLGVVVQFGMTNLAAKHSDVIMSITRNLFQKSDEEKEE
jgi:hypothetical protein